MTERIVCGGWRLSVVMMIFGTAVGALAMVAQAVLSVLRLDLSSLVLVPLALVSGAVAWWLASQRNNLVGE